METTDAGSETCLKHATNLRALYVARWHMTEEGVESLKQCKSLEQLQVYGIPAGFGPESGTFTADNLAQIEALLKGSSSLRELHLMNLPDDQLGPITASIPEWQKARPDLKFRVTGHNGFSETFAPTAPAEPDYAAERAAAEWVLSVGGYVLVWSPDNINGPIDYDSRQGEPLPKGNFVVNTIGLERNNRPEQKLLEPDDYQKLSRLSGVLFLHLNWQQPGAEGLEYISNLKTLNTLYLDGAELSDQSLVHINRLTNLHMLSLNGTGITDDGLLHLTDHSKLQQLSLGSGITQRGTDFIVSRNPDLWHLRMQRTDTGSESCLKHAANIRHLYVSTRHITAESVEALKQSKTLEQLHIYGMIADDLPDRGTFVSDDLDHLESAIYEIESLQLVSLTNLRKPVFDAVTSRIPAWQKQRPDMTFMVGDRGKKKTYEPTAK